ncbi:phage integrase SAM-like domain-containing protein [Elizabethkingia anophelis]|uniref:phage integrase SAM-like domain-containing protein n=1 Tax=Elizabethkingia anophelis TaxID=1117645 RepID=UPI00200DE654|nr:phage integrase SAM-like domain-containing protein [Elizabethkingia anophelis]MCL1035517.1 site-specific integrase [Elizabethkingia anophelis]
MTLDFSLSGNTVLKNINLILNIDRVNFKLHTSLRIPGEQWDEEKKRPKNIYLKKYKKLNNKLDSLKKELILHLNQRQIQKKEINQKSLSRVVQRIMDGNKDLQLKNSLLSLIQSYIAERSDFICYSTYKRYKVFYNLIQRFEGYIMKHLFIEDINMEFVKKFIAFGKEEKYSENTIYRTIHFVKTILNFVEKKGVRTSVREMNIKREKQQKEIVSLSENEILKIEKTKLPEELNAAKDWLVISCYTGQRFSDFIKFSIDKMIEIKGKQCIQFTQQKTNKKIVLPLHPKVKDILHRNKNSFPKTLDIITYNKHIKLIAKITGINNTLSARKRVGHRVKSFTMEKWQTITSHIGRRSFATNFYGKIPTPLLLHATGHSTEQIFLNYINDFDNDRITSLGDHFDKLHQTIITNPNL